jgi:AcrR family transcriptional regulator
MVEGEIGTSEKILNAAYTCISTRGYANVSMRDIAKEANVALSQINYYYKNKEGLFDAVLNSLKEKVVQNIEIKLQQIDTTQDRMAFLIAYCNELVTKNTEIYRLIVDFFSMAMWSESFSKSLKEFLKEVYGKIEQYIENDYIENKNIQASSPNLLIRVMIGSIFGIAMHYILDNDDKEILEGIHIIESVIQ